MTVDPATLMLTGTVSVDMDSAPADFGPRMAANELLDDDFLKFCDLVRAPTPVGSLGLVTGGSLGRSTRFRDIYQPAGLGDELRAVLVSRGTCWGRILLHRGATSPHFTPAEVALVGRLATDLADGIRTALLLGDIESSGGADLDGPGLVVLDRSLQLVATTPAGERWCAELRASEVNPRDIPAAVYGAALRLQALGEVQLGADESSPRVRARTASGTWVVVHASWLTGAADGSIAAVVEPARPVEVASLLVEAYALSPREQDITGLVLRGLSTAQIADRLGIAPATVQDHLKVVFDRAGVHSRRELTARLYAQEHAPRIAAREAHGHDGQFRSLQPRPSPQPNGLGLTPRPSPCPGR